MCSEMTSHSSKNASFARARRRSRRRARARATPRAPRRARSCRTPCRSRRRRRRCGRSRRCRASCRASVVPTPICHAPAASAAICCGICRIAARISAQVSSAAGVRRRVGVLVRRDDDAAPRAGVDVDVRIDAALADQPQLSAGARAAARGSACARGSEPAPRCRARRCGERLDVLHVIVPDRRRRGRRACAKHGERAQRVEVVVENRDLQWRAARCLVVWRTARRPARLSSLCCVDGHPASPASIGRHARGGRPDSTQRPIASTVPAPDRAFDCVAIRARRQGDPFRGRDHSMVITRGNHVQTSVMRASQAVDHRHASSGSRRDFIKASTAAAAAAGAMNLFTPRTALADDGRGPPDDHGRPGRPRHHPRRCRDVDGPARSATFRRPTCWSKARRSSPSGRNLHAGGAAVIDARGRIVMPGFIDTHHHQFETALRSFLADGILINDGSNTPSGNTTYFEFILLKFAPVYRPQDVYINELFGAPEPARRGRHDGARHLADPSLARSIRTPRSRRSFDYGAPRRLRLFRERGRRRRQPVSGTTRSASRTSGSRRATSSSTMIMGGEVYLGAPTTTRSPGRSARQLGLQVAAHILSPFGIRPILDHARAGQGRRQRQHRTRTRQPVHPHDRACPTSAGRASRTPAHRSRSPCRSR